MSQHTSPNAGPSGPATIESGLDAFESSPEFRGPVERLDGHRCNDHFAHIYKTAEERFAAAVPFVRHGLERGERVMYVVDESSERTVKEALAAAGVDVESALASGALTFHTVGETYLRTGTFEPDEMVEFYAETVAEATEEYEALRIVAEMTWLQDDATTVEQFMEYEAKVNDLFAETESLAICQYDREGFPPEIIRDIVRTHPHLIYDGAVCHNVYYTPPAEFFGPEDPGEEVDRMLGTLRERTAAKAELTEHRQFLHDLYEIAAASDRSFEEKLQALFELGCEQFDIDFGFLNRVDPQTDRLEIEYASGDHDHYEVGGVLPLSETYCQAAVDIEAAASVSDPVEDGFDDLVVYEDFGVDTYLGTYIPVEGGPDRTLAFVPGESREEPFSERDKAFIELMGQWVGYELNRRQREQFLRECYEITADPARGFDEKLDALLELGCEQFGLDYGGMARVDPDRDLFEVEVINGDHDHLVPGNQYPLSETYCRLAAAEGEIAAVTDPVDAGFEGTLCYEQFGVQTYLGTHLPVDGDLDRTFWFVSNDRRDAPITEMERTFVHLMGQWVRYELERQQREQFLRECYETTADPGLDFEEKLHRLLDRLREWTGLDAAGLTHLPEWEGKFLNEYALGYGDGDGAVDASDDVWTDPGEGCYCRQAVNADEPVGMADVRGTEWEDDDIHREHGLTCYLGTKVTSGSTPYGTLWVGSTEPRDREFSETERTFLELVGQWVSYEIERRDHSETQRELYEITADPDLDFEGKLDELFDLGRERFGLDYGGLARIDPERDWLEVQAISGDHEHLVPGKQPTLSETHCRLVTDSTETVSVTDAAAAGLDDTTSYQEFGVDAYLGTRIPLDDGPDATLFFFSEEPRDREFSEAERSFHHLMGQWVRYELERRQRERELRERTDHLNALIDTTPECIKTVAPDGTLLQMNASGLEMVEAPSASAVTGECVYDLIAPEHRDRFREFNERICRGERGTLEFDIIGLEGTRRHMESHAAPLERPDGTTVHVALTRDVTEQKERQAELERVLDLLERTERIADVGGWEIDPDTLDVFWTDQIFELLELPGDEEPPLDEALDMYLEEDQQMVEAAVQDALDSGDPFDIEARIRTGSGEVRWLCLQGIPEIVDGEVVSLRGAAQDVTDRKEREAELRQTKNRFETVFEQSDDGIFIIDPDADELVDANPAAAEMTGYTRDELVSLTPSDLHPDELEQFHAFLDEVQETGSAWSEDLHCRHRDGRDIPAEITASTITLDGRSLVLALVRDISERKKYERYQRDLYEITADPDLETDEKVERLLEVGCEYLDLPTGMLTHERGETRRVERMHGDHPDVSEGTFVPRSSEHYCQRVVETESPVAVADAGAAGWEGDPLYDDLGLDAYAGVPVTVGGETYGTLCFADTSSRRAEFTEAEQAFLELLGQCVGYELERTRRETRLHMLSTLGRELLDTETAADVAERFVAVAEDALAHPMAAVGLYDDETGELRPAAHTAAAGELVEAASLVDGTDGAGWEAFVSREPVRVAAPLDDAAADPPVSEAVVHPLGNHGVLLVGAAAPGGFRGGDMEVVETAAANVRAALDRADRERQLQEREEILEEQNRTLERLDRINDTIRSIDQALVEASTRDEVEAVVCEELADVGPYALAWIGEHDSLADELTPREWAGTARGYLDEVTITLDDQDRGPTARAARAREPQVVNDILDDESAEPWRRAALNRGYHALVALPLVYEDTLYGVLNVYAEQPGVFDELERAVLAELSDTIAYAINAVESKKALVSNEKTELEFAVRDASHPLVGLTAEADCEVALESLVPRKDSGLHAFITTRGVAADEVIDAHPPQVAADLTVISEYEEDGEPVCLFDVALAEGSISQTTLEHGGVVRKITAEDGTARFVVELASDAETREFVETVQTKYPDTSLVAHRTQEYTPRTRLGFYDRLLETLTNRQLEVLQTAYVSGYFEEPRFRTASDLADLLDITQPTFNSHLRAACRNLCGQLFDDNTVLSSAVAEAEET